MLLLFPLFIDRRPTLPLLCLDDGMSNERPVSCWLCQNLTPSYSSKIRVEFPEGSLEKVPPDSKLMAILDEDWPAFLEEKRCMVRDRLNRWVVTLEADQTRGKEASFETVITQASSRVKLMLVSSASGALIFWN